MRCLFTNSVRRQIIFATLLGFAACPLRADFPRQFTHQGKISAGGTTFTGTGHFKFLLYHADTNTGAAPMAIWSNASSSPADTTEPTVAIDVEVNNGFYHVGIGDTRVAGMAELVAPLEPPAGKSLFLRVWFSDGINPSEQLSPDLALGSVPFSIEALRLSGVDSARLVQTSFNDAIAWSGGIAGPQNSTAWNSGEASGIGATAWGSQSKAAGESSTAWSTGNAQASYSTAWGGGVAANFWTTAWNFGEAGGIGATAWSGGEARGIYSTAWGSASSAEGNDSTAWSGGEAIGDSSTAWGSGWAPGIGATAWNEGRATATGATAWAGGEARGVFSTAWGVVARADGDFSTAWSSGSALGESSTAWSSGSADGESSTAWSLGRAQGENSTAWSGGDANGLGATSWSFGFAIGDSATAWSGGIASGINATAWGEAEASGVNSTAWGGSRASATGSTAWGQGSHADGNESTAWASGRAFGIASTAWAGGEANNNGATAWSAGSANGLESTAWGAGDASGILSTAWNQGRAEGDRSTAAGDGAVAYSAYEVALGTFVAPYVPVSPSSFAPGDRVFVVGNGTANNSRSNALTILKNGNIGLNGVSQPTHPLEAASGAHLSTGGTWTNASDRALKENVAPVNEENLLEQIRSLPIYEWNYRSEGTGVRHVGPMAQDFHDAFSLGDNEKTISTVDADGVAIAAIQALARKIDQLSAENARLRERIGKLEDQMPSPK